MKNLLLLMALFCLQAIPASAQTKDVTQYLVYSYHKVAPGMNGKFLKLAQVWKKILINQALPGPPPSQVWSLSKMVTSIGPKNEYDYVTLRVLTGKDSLAKYLNLKQPYLPDNWQSNLAPDEIDLVLKADSIRTFVKLEAWPIDTVISPSKTTHPDTSPIILAVYNYFKEPKGKTLQDAVKMEREIWLPIHQARIDDDNMRLWFLLTLDFPVGASQPYNMLTIDDYTDLDQYLKSGDKNYFKGKCKRKLLKKTNEAATLVKRDIRIILDRL
ncbi:MAG: hypothetical protein ACKVT2_06875 [Saprospiraceae bacterium]